MRRGLRDEARAPSQKTDEELQRLERERQKRGMHMGGGPFSVTSITRVLRDGEDKVEGNVCLIGNTLSGSIFAGEKMTFIRLF